MKANEAPEKIYLSDFTDTTEAVFYVKKDNTKKTDIEYTRTDAIQVKEVQEEPISKDLGKAARDYTNNIDNICGSIGEQARHAFKTGAQWQKKQLIEKACEWLSDHVFEYLQDVSHFNGTWDIDTQKLIPDFRKAMKGE